ncbi:copper-transporting P-type ATPase [Scheffersomyces xylosifermentans]|uniref:copper-transporting P-type ATPase n=1 Tax=Scheffersomyces xylosifermentans TaxID=1304137 RepID=UPI00315D8058
MACCVVAAGVYVALNSFYDKTKFDVSSSVVIGLPEPDHNFKYESVSSLTLEVSGMTCSSCVSSIESEISKMPGVTAVKVSLLMETCTIAYDPALIIDLNQLQKAIEDIGFEARAHSGDPQSGSLHEQRKLEQLKKIYSKFVLSGVLAALTWIFKTLSRAQFLIELQNFFLILSLILASISQFYIGPTFYKPTWNTIKNRKPFTMDTLVALSTTFTYVISFTYLVDFYLDSGKLKEEYLDNFCFDLSSGILFVILGGKYYESLGKLKLSSNLSNLNSLLPESALLLKKDGSAVQVPCSVIKKDDFVIVRPGSKIPIDGTVKSGVSLIDELCITGEPTPVRKEPESTVLAGTYNKTATITVQANSPIQDSKISQLFTIISDTSVVKGTVVNYIQSTINIFVPTIIILSLLTYSYWMFMSEGESDLSASQYARMRALAVITIACPCALGLAVPAAITQGMNYASSKGCYIRGSGLDILMQIVNKKKGSKAFVLFDKTGTLTTRDITLTDFRYKKNNTHIDKSLFWKLVESAESYEEHPIAKTIVDYSQSKISELEEVKAKNPHCIEFQYLPSKGVDCQVLYDNKNYEVKIGNHYILPDAYKSKKSTSDLYFIINNELYAECKLVNTVRSESEILLQYLSEEGYEVGLITGDRSDAAIGICSKLGIKNYWFECTPEDKLNITKNIKRDFDMPVIMVGDGMNDAAALTEADLGISLSTAHQLSIDSSEIVLMKDNLLSIIDMLRISVLTKRKMMFNIWVCILYNVIMIPLAMGVFTRWNISISPQWSSTLMSFNSVFVLASSLLLGR